MDVGLEGLEYYHCRAGGCSVGLCQGDTPLVLSAVLAVGWSVVRSCVLQCRGVVFTGVLFSAGCWIVQCNAVSRPLNHTARIHG